MRQAGEKAFRLRRASGGADLRLDRAPTAEGDVVRRRRREQRRVLSDERHPRPDRLGVSRPQIDPVNANRAGGRIVKAQEKAEHRALAGPRRSHQGDALAGPDRQGEIIQRRNIAARIGESHALESYLAPGRRRQGCRSRRRRNGRGGLQDVDDPPRGAGGFLNLAPDLGQVAQTGGRDHRQNQQLQQIAAAHGLFDDHGQGALVEQGQHAGEDESDHQARHQTTDAKLGAGGPEGSLYGGVEAGRDGLLLAEGLNRIDGL